MFLFGIRLWENRSIPHSDKYAACFLSEYIFKRTQEKGSIENKWRVKINMMFSDLESEQPKIECLKTSCFCNKKKRSCQWLSHFSQKHGVFSEQWPSQWKIRRFFVLLMPIRFHWLINPYLWFYFFQFSDSLGFLHELLIVEKTVLKTSFTFWLLEILGIE